MRRTSLRYGTLVTAVDACVFAPPLRRALSNSPVVRSKIPLQINRQNQSQVVVPMHGWYRTLQVNMP